MEDKILELCKRVEKIKNNNWKCYHEFYCAECPFGSKKNNGKYCGEDTHENYIQIARNYIKEHEKTVNTIEKIEKNEDISRDLIEDHNFTKATVTLKELQEIKKDNIIPTYYHKGNYDVIQFCNDNYIDFTTGNIIKYITRYKYKNGIEDLKKAKECIRRSDVMEYEISLENLIRFNLENNLDYVQGKIIECVIENNKDLANILIDVLIKDEEKKIKEIEETYQTEGMAD